MSLFHCKFISTSLFSFIAYSKGSIQLYNLSILILLKHSVVALTLASVFFMYTFCILAYNFEMKVLIIKAIINTPSPARKDAPMYIESRKKQTVNTMGYFAI
jgi:hypothetical protein